MHGLWSVDTDEADLFLTTCKLHGHGVAICNGNNRAMHTTVCIWLNGGRCTRRQHNTDGRNGNDGVARHARLIS